MKVVRKRIQGSNLLAMGRTLDWFDLSKANTLDVRAFKEDLRRQYRVLAKRFHPDGRPDHYISGWSFNRITRVYNQLMALDTVPLTLENFERVLEATKGYR